MRRSILIVMLDVMVLSVLALTSGLRTGGADGSLPVPMYGLSGMVEEGLQNEQNLQGKIDLLESQLASANALATKALEQAQMLQLDAGREREGNQVMQARLHQAELDAEKLRSRAELATIETALSARLAAEAERRAAEMDRRASEMEQREADARARSELALAKAREAEADALAAERRAVAASSNTEVLQQEIRQVQQERTKAELAEEAAREKLRLMERQLAENQVTLVTAQATASAATETRDRLIAQSDQRIENVAQLRETVAVLKVQNDGVAQQVVKLETEQKEAAAEAAKSIWVRRDEALRHLKVRYTEYSKRNDRSYTTRRELTMPMVKMGDSVFIPAEFKQLGLNANFFGGLSDAVTDVKGELSPVAAPDGVSNPISSILVPGTEPQVCFVRFAGKGEGAIESMSMAALKTRRLKEALLFSSEDVSEHARVEIMPVVGSSYLKIIAAEGKKPKVGDYLMSERGEFIGVMVTKEDCYVTPQEFGLSPAPLSIPMVRTQGSDLYFDDFTHMLNAARDRLDAHLSKRKL